MTVGGPGAGPRRGPKTGPLLLHPLDTLDTVSMHLFRNRRFALLFAGQAVNGIGSWAALIALWGFGAYKFHSGGTRIALLSMCWAVPAAVLGPLAGVPIDRLGPRRVLIGAYTCSAVAALAMAMTRSFGQLAAVAVFYGATKAFSTPAADSLPPRIVSGPDLLAANALLGAAYESSIVFGPLVAAAAIAAAGLRAAFFVDAATYLVGIGVVVPLVLSPVAQSPPGRRRLRDELAEGWRLAAASPLLRYVLTLSTAVFLTWAAFVVVEPLYARDVLHRPASQFALFQVAFGVGLVATGLVVPRLGERVAGVRPLAIGVVLSGLTAGLYVGTHSIACAYVGVFLWGVDVAFFGAPSRTLLQRGAPVEAHGRVLALYRTAHSIGDVVALPLTGLLVAGVGVQRAGLAVAALASAAGVAGFVVARRVPAPGSSSATGAESGFEPVDALAGLAADPLPPVPPGEALLPAG
jgi:predicted MFS family arabinose efflux permease